MEEKIALVNCLALLNLEQKLNEKGSYSNLIKKAATHIKAPEFVSDGDSHAAVAGVKHLVIDLANGDLEYDLNTVLQKIRVYCALDGHLYESVKDVFATEYKDENEIKKAISSNISHLQHYINGSELRKLISSASYAVNRDAEANLNEVAAKLSDDLARVSRNALGGKSTTLVASVGTDTPEDMEVIFNNTKKQMAGATLKTGWKDINQMLGVNGGMLPGELWILPALPHNAKTLFSLLTFISLGLFNSPDDFVPEGKKPMMLDMSFENELEVNMPIAYKAIHDHFEGKGANIREIDPKAAVRYVCEKLSEKGWTYKFERHISSDFTPAMLRERFAHYESQGYHIVGLRADYLGVINRAGLGSGAIGSDVREMYRIIRNITTPRKCLVLAPHQLSPKAKELRAVDPARYVRQLPGKGFYDGCTTVDNEADGELYFGITEMGEKSYLEVQRGKHRTLIDTPMAHRYRVIPFADIGILPWDYDKDYNVCLKSVSAAAMGSDGDDLFGLDGY